MSPIALSFISLISEYSNKRPNLLHTSSKIASIFYLNLCSGVSYNIGKCLDSRLPADNSQAYMASRKWNSSTVSPIWPAVSLYGRQSPYMAGSLPYMAGSLPYTAGSLPYMASSPPIWPAVPLYGR